MAFAILQAAIGAAISGDTWIGLPANQLQLKDQNGTSSTSLNVQSATTAFVSGVRTVRALVWVKTYNNGASATLFTPGTVCALEVADNGPFTTNVRSIASYQMLRMTQSFYINGVVPDNLTAQWCRLAFAFNGTSTNTDTFSYDADIEAS